jgi:hypothetical protein
MLTDVKFYPAVTITLLLCNPGTDVPPEERRVEDDLQDDLLVTRKLAEAFVERMVRVLSTSSHKSWCILTLTLIVTHSFVR